MHPLSRLRASIHPTRNRICSTNVNTPAAVQAAVAVCTVDRNRMKFGWREIQLLPSQPFQVELLPSRNLLAAESVNVLSFQDERIVDILQCALYVRSCRS